MATPPPPPPATLVVVVVVVVGGGDDWVRFWCRRVAVGWMWRVSFLSFFSSGAFSVAEDGRLFFFGNEMMMGTMMDGGGLWCQTGVNGCAVTSRLGPLLSASMPGSRFAAFRLPMDCFMELNESLYIDISCGGGAAAAAAAAAAGGRQWGEMAGKWINESAIFFFFSSISAVF